MTKKQLIIFGIVAAAAIVGLVLYLRHRRAAEAAAAAEAAKERPPVGPIRPGMQQVIAPPPGSVAGPSTRDQVLASAKLAATAGCVAYTSGTAAPICGLAAPLAVDLAAKGSGYVTKAASSVGSKIASALGF